MNNNSNRLKKANPSKVPLIAFIFGILSIVCSLIIGNASFQPSVNDFEQQYRKFYLREAKLLVKSADVYRFNDDETLLNRIQSIWNTSTEKAARNAIPAAGPFAWMCLNSQYYLHLRRRETPENEF